jgi:hypothetical protein
LHNPQHVSNSEQHFSIDIPSDRQCPDKRPSAVIFSAKAPTETEPGYFDSVLIMTKPLDKPLTLEEFRGVVVKNSFQEEQPILCTISGIQAIKQIFSHNSTKRGETRVMVYCFIKQGAGYAIICESANPDSLTKAQNTFEAIAMSLKFDQ